MQMRRASLAAVVLSALLCHTPLAAENVAQVFAKGGVTGLGARAMGMGGAFVAQADDSSAVYWNPAGLVQLYRPEIHFMGGALMNGKVLNSYLAVLQPFADQMVAGVATELRSHTSGNRANHGVYYATFAMPLNIEKTVAFGVNIKYFSARSSRISNYRAGGWGTDLGFLLRLPLPWLERYGKEVDLGLMVEDLSTHLRWATGAEERIPTRVRAGLAYRLNDNLTVEFDAETFEGLSGGTVLTKVPTPVPTPPTPTATPRPGAVTHKNSKMRSGIEGWFFQEKLGLRLGYVGFSTLSGRYTTGITYRARSWNLDYAFLGHAQHLGASHRVSACLRFGRAMGRRVSFVPQALRYEVEEGVLYLVWDKPRGINLAGYNVYVTQIPGRAYAKVKTDLLKDNYTPLHGFRENQKYYFVVTSVLADNITESEFSKELEVIYSEALRPPEIIASSEEEAVIYVPWAPQAGVDGFNVYFCEFKDGDYERVNDGLIKTPEYLIRSSRLRLKIGKKYFIKVTAIRGGMESPPTNPKELIAVPASSVGK